MSIRVQFKESISISLRRYRWLLICCGIALLVSLGCCVFFRISNLSDVHACLGMIKNPAPMVKDFAFRHFKGGDSLSSLQQRYPTNEAGNFGGFSLIRSDCWVDAQNRTSLQVFAINDKLVLAVADGSLNGVPWNFTFFHTTNDAEMSKDFDRATDEWFKQVRQKRPLAGHEVKSGL